MPNGSREPAYPRRIPVDLLGINPRQSPLDGMRRVGLKDFQLVGRACTEVHLGGLDVGVTEPNRDSPDVGEPVVRINAERIGRQTAPLRRFLQPTRHYTLLGIKRIAA